MTRIIIAALIISFSATSIHSEPVGLANSKAQAGMAMAASYLGMAEFCKAYGVDFTEVAQRVIDGMRHSTLKNDDRALFIFDRMVHAGNLGNLYSPQKDELIDLVATGTDLRKICDASYQQVLIISKLK